MAIHGQFNERSQYLSLMNILRSASAVLTTVGSLNAFVQTDDGRDVLSLDMEEENAYDRVAGLFASGTIVSLDVGFPLEGREHRFNCDPTYEGQLSITLLGDVQILDDGMIDFNWYYRFWSTIARKHITVEGVEFSVFE